MQGPRERQISAAASVQGLLVDSFYVKDFSVQQYVDRTNEYVSQLKSSVSVWEVGNEINGEWVGEASEVAAKIQGSYDAVRSEGGKTALTLYYNGSYDNGQATSNNCWEKPENQMQVWADAHVPQALKDGLDYVLVSYYEDDCNGIQPNWVEVFASLAAMFPNAKLGIGECGTELVDQKASYIQRYYQHLQAGQDRFVGGYFWWYGKQDFVPKTNPLWKVLQDAMDAREAAEK